MQIRVEGIGKEAEVKAQMRRDQECVKHKASFPYL